MGLTMARLLTEERSLLDIFRIARKTGYTPELFRELFNGFSKKNITSALISAIYRASDEWPHFDYKSAAKIIKEFYPRAASNIIIDNAFPPGIKETEEKIKSVKEFAKKMKNKPLKLKAITEKNIILHIILIPRYQQIGAAVATLISLLVLFILNLSVVPKIIKFDYKFLLIKTLKSLLSVSIMAILLLAIKSYFNFIILIIAGAIIYIGIMYLIKGFTKDDLKYLIQTIFKKEKNISEIPEEEALTST